MTERLSPQRETEMTPVGYFCNHSDEKPGERTHHDWEWSEGDGYVFRHLPDTISSHTSVDRLYLKPENRGTRCPRAVPVYTGPDVAAELAAVRAERDEARAELAKYIGHEPTIAEEMAYLSRCVDAVSDLCDVTEAQAKRWENPLPIPEWVDRVRAALEEADL